MGGREGGRWGRFGGGGWWGGGGNVTNLKVLSLIMTYLGHFGLQRPPE